jgi:hypothetical protein
LPLIQILEFRHGTQGGGYLPLPRGFFGAINNAFSE